MATNNNLQNISLGAPTSIEVSQNQCPNAVMRVQIASTMRSIKLHDGADGSKCTSLGALHQAAALLRQYFAERDAVPSGNLSIEPMTADFVLNGGTVTLRCLDADGNTVKCGWTVLENLDEPIGSYSLSPDGVLTVPSGCYAAIKVKAISFADSTDCCEAVLVGGCLTNPILAPVIVENPILAPVIVENPILAPIIVENPILAPIITKYPALVGIIDERPALAPIIVEWPQVVNSLVETGKRNWLVGDRNAYIKTDFKRTPESTLDVTILCHVNQSGWVAIFGGEQGTTDSAAIGLWRNSGNYFGLHNVGSASSSSGTCIVDTVYNALYDASSITINGTVMRTNGTPTTSNYPVWLFWANRNGSGADNKFNGKISDFIFGKTTAGDVHLVPFVRNGVNGFLNIAEGADFNHFYTNANSSGSFAITTEPK